MRVGYARVSSSGQHLDVQRTALTDAGCEKIYAEKVSGVGERWGCGDELNSYYFGNGQDIDIHLPTNSDKYMLVIRDHVSPNPDYQLISRLKYVHKLQHALKEYKYEKITIKL